MEAIEIALCDVVWRVSSAISVADVSVLVDYRNAFIGILDRLLTAGTELVQFTVSSLLFAFYRFISQGLFCPIGRVCAVCIRFWYIKQVYDKNFTLSIIITDGDRAQLKHRLAQPLQTRIFEYVLAALEDTLEAGSEAAVRQREIFVAFCKHLSENVIDCKFLVELLAKFYGTVCDYLALKKQISLLCASRTSRSATSSSSLYHASEN